MSETEIISQTTAPRDIIITNRGLENGNVEAWINIIQSYKAAHPEHDVVIFYEGTAVNNMISLFKMDKAPNLNGFQMVVTARDGNLKNVPKLYRFLVEGASPRFERFLNKDMYQVLKLF